MQQTFALVAGFARGNAFTNANKLLDHVMAHGPAAQDRNHRCFTAAYGCQRSIVEKAAAFLRAAGLFPDAGYLHCPTEAAETRITDDEIQQGQEPGDIQTKERT